MKRIKFWLGNLLAVMGIMFVLAYLLLLLVL